MQRVPLHLGEPDGVHGRRGGVLADAGEPPRAPAGGARERPAVGARGCAAAAESGDRGRGGRARGVMRREQAIAAAFYFVHGGCSGRVHGVDANKQ
jgi:hypothetical protein